MDLAREVGADGPGLGMGLVEDDAREFGVSGHIGKVDKGPGVVNGGALAHVRNNSTRGCD